MAYTAIGVDAVYGQKVRQLAAAGPEEMRKEGVSGLLGAFLDTEQELAVKSIEIRFDQLRFDLESVEEVFGLDDGENEPMVAKDACTAKPPTTELQSEDIEIHPIKIIISRVLEKKPHILANRVWNLIKNDFNSETRKYDVDGVISTMDSEIIEWFGHGDTIKVLKYKTFRNYVSNLKTKRN
ncbi:hypothetical protein [Veronia nyctiphanis]|uniref:hypothetical protein n=1 Tax=Veronia nyctiphanis TaxID=1278244 RepID=UPI00100A39D9|nr:hypothetical protein [Veronia nyctiphanis]